jgi:hypothetical protein
MAEEAKPYGVLAEFATPDALVAAAVKVRDAGYRQWDCMTPYPVHGLDAAMGMKRTRLPFVIFVGGLLGFAGALLLQWWTNAVDYPFIISGKPFFSLPANIPIIFELTVLVSAITAVVAMLTANKLPELAHPTLRSERFRRVTDNQYFIVIEADDPRFDPHETPGFLTSLGAEHVEVLEA